MDSMMEQRVASQMGPKRSPTPKRAAKLRKIKPLPMMRKMGMK